MRTPFWRNALRKAQPNSTDAPARPRAPRQVPRVEELEPRILFSADAVAGALADLRSTWSSDETAPVWQAYAPEQRVSTPTATDEDDDKRLTDALLQSLSAGHSDGQVRTGEVVFIDGSVLQQQALLDAMGPGVDVVVLDATRDGLTQIADYLNGRTGLSAVHIISEGDVGRMQLGDSWLDTQALARYQDQLSAIGASLAPGGDLLLYGCRTGEGDVGEQFVDRLARLTNADVAASTDWTGASALGGNWVLERQSGQIEAASILTAQSASSFDAVLGTYYVTNTADTGAGSLRQAIIDANNNGGADDIVFNIAGGGAQTITLNTALPTITGRVNLDATTQSGFVGVPLIQLNGNSLSGANVLSLTSGASNSVIRGFIINRAGLDGILLTNTTGVTIAGNYIGTNAAGTAALANGDDGIEIDGGSGNIIGGTNPADRNVISGNVSTGIYIQSGSTNNVVVGNYIGTNAAGTAAIANEYGILATSANNTIGGTSAAQRNVISGNTLHGIVLYQSATSNTVSGNYIGSNAAGTAGVSNGGTGIVIDYGASNNTIGGTTAGAGNVIAYNVDDGIWLIENNPVPTGNALLGNSIHSNGGMGIDLGEQGTTANDAGDADTGPNNLQNTPVISSARVNGDSTSVTWSFNSQASRSYRIEFFASGSGNQGQVYLGFVNVVTNGSGNVTSTTTTTLSGVPLNTRQITATATDLTTNDTSEFSAAVTATSAPYVTTSGGTTSYTENAAPVVIDGALTISDPDSSTLASATVSITANFASGQDLLAFTNNGSTMGNISASFNAGTGVLTLTSSGATATLAQWQAALRAVTYSNTSDNPSASARQISFGASDSTGAGGTAAKTVTVTAVSDAPSGADNTVTLAQEGTRTFSAADFGFNDVDGDALAGVRITNFLGQGTLTNNGATVNNGDFISASDIALNRLVYTPAAGGRGLAYASFSFQVQDNGSTAGGGVNLDPTPNLLTLNVTPTDSAAATTYVVTNTNDAGAGSLRQAIINANTTTGTDTITFAIGTGARTITLSTALPAITGTVVIDATTQAGYVNRPLITLDGSATTTGSGFNIAGANNTVIRGFAITGFTDYGIRATASTSIIIVANHIGVDATGTSAAGNGSGGIYLLTGAHNAVIGGSSAAERNVISGNNGDGIDVYQSNGVVIEGNYIGLNATGTAAIGNSGDGIRVAISAGNLRVGSTVAGGGNVISGNGGNGVLIVSNSGTTLQGNYIGTNAAGTMGIANGMSGVQVQNASNAVIGGASAGAGNLISGNQRNGVDLQAGSDGTTILGNAIGLNAAGTGSIANSWHGINVESGSNSIGSAAPGGRNVISGNTQTGIRLHGATGNSIIGNYIGTSTSGNAAVANGWAGVRLSNNSIGTQIGGTAAGAGNVISGNVEHGIDVQSGSDITAEGNYIGINASGNTALANGWSGINIESGYSLIGGTTSAARNVISGNSQRGISLRGDFNTVSGNYIGTDATGTTNVANNWSGIELHNGADDNTIGGTADGEGNVIAFNNDRGIYMNDGLGNVFYRNAIYSNGGLGIDLGPAGVTSNDPGDGDSGANNLQNFPVISSAQIGASGTIVTWSLNSEPSTNYRIEFFAGSGSGNAQVYLGFVNVISNGSGNVTTTVTSTLAGTSYSNRYITATATNLNSTETSELAASVQSTSAYIGTAGTTTGYTAGGSAVPIDPSLTVSDPNNGSLASATVSITGNFVSAQDVLAFTNNGSTMGNIAASYDAATGVLTLTSAGATAALSEWQAALRAVTYSNVSGAPNTSNRTITFVGNDGTGPGGPATQTVSVAASMAPVVTASGGSTSYSTNGVATVVDAGITVNDPDQATLASATVSVSGNFSAGHDVLAFTNDGSTMGNIGASYDATGGVLTLTSAGSTATLAQWQAALRAVTFVETSGTPTTGARTVSFIVNDGTTSSTASSKTVNIAVTHYIVTTASDSGLGSLRQAIIDANANPGANGISFNIPGPLGSVQTISLSSALPAITGRITIDATTQPGYGSSGVEGLPRITLDGSATTNSDGLQFLAGSSSSVVRGLAIINFDNAGIFITDASGITLTANHLGVDATGTTAAGNSHGIFLGPNSNNVTIGGSTAAERNVISGNSGNGIRVDDSSDNIIRGNYIGTNAAGTAAVGNGLSGIELIDASIQNVISRNVVSGNQQGIRLAAGSNDTTITGNYIGTNAAGTAAIANGWNGIGVFSDGNTIGGTTAAARNIISGNHEDGIRLDRAADNVIIGNYIGTDVTGTIAIGNSWNGILLINGSIDANIGGSAAGAGNVISGNGRSGIVLESGSTGATILGNHIGTNAAGTAALANQRDGISVQTASNTIGGTSSSQRNVISGNAGHGIRLDSASQVSVIGNYIGTNAAGTSALGNGGFGMQVINGSSENTIGGTAAGSGNLVSGNMLHGIALLDTSGDNEILGNFIGTNAAGTSAIGNGWEGINVESDDNVIGGTSAGARNVVSGNTGHGIRLDGAASNTILGNYIGTNAAGTGAIANGNNGIVLDNGSLNNTIGGTAAGAGNVVSGNTQNGIGLQPGSNNNTIRGNYVGVNAAGGAILANGWSGIAIQSDNNIIGGTSASARNIVSGNGRHGIDIYNNATNNTVRGNYIGLNAAGTSAIANSWNGLLLGAGGNIIGGSAAGAGNVISGNSQRGIDVASNGNTIQGNAIGTNAAGTGAVANAWSGIEVVNGSNNAIGGINAGEGNIIAFNGDRGVRVTAGTGNFIARNSIHSNASLGIDLNGDGVTANDAGDADGGPNRYQNFPVLAGVSAGAGGVLAGTLHSAASRTYRIELFASDSADGSGHGEGQRFLGAFDVVTDASGYASFNASYAGINVGDWISATATDLTTNDTSEFGLSAQATSAPVVATSGPTTGYTENGAALAVDPTLTVYDANSNVMSHATISITGNFVTGQDVLAFVNDGISMGNISTVSYDASSGVLTLISAGGTATVAQWQAALRAVTYVNSSDAPGTAARTISFVVNNGLANSPTATKTLSVTAVNDAPQVITSGGTTAYTEDDAATVIDPGVTVADPDNAALVSATVSISLNFSAGQDVLAFVNDGSTMGDITGSYNAATGMLTLTSAGGNVTTAQWQAALRAVTYLNTSQTPDGSSRSVTFSVFDGNSSGASTKTLSVTSVNDAPVATASGGTTSYTVNGTATVIDAGITVNDPDQATLASATVSVSGNFSAGHDVLAFTNDGSTMGNISASYDATSGVLTLTSAGSTATLAQWQAALRAVTFVETSGTPATGARTVSFIVNDGTTSSTASSKTVNIAVTHYIVTTASDSGLGSLRQAIIDANANAGANGIRFNIGSGAVTIHLLSALPALTDTVTLDATTQPGYAGTPLVTLAGDAAGAGAHGLQVLSGASGSTIRGLAITGFSSHGLYSHGATGLTIQANHIGIDSAGVAAGNDSDGIFLDAGSHDAVVGGPLVADRNVISGNGVNGITVVDSTGVLIQGNRIGTNVAGTAAVANGGSGVYVNGVATGTVVGGTSAGAGNVISGNGADGIVLQDTVVTVQGNHIGLDATGTAAIANAHSGLYVFGNSSGTTIGGAAAGARNVISGNGAHGIYVDGSDGISVVGNYVGTSVNGDMPVSNGLSGIKIERSANSVIGGTAAGSGNVVSGNATHGVEIWQSNGTVLHGNLIGTNAAGNAALGNVIGVLLVAADNTQLGGSAVGAANVIAGNTGDGINIEGTRSAVVRGNYIGTNAAAASLGNGVHGVYFYSNTQDNVIGGTAPGEGNIIAYNADHGISTGGTGVQGNSFLGNVIHGNGSIGIDLNGDGVTPNDAGDADTGSNNLQNYPVIIGAAPGATTHVTGALNSTPSRTLRIEFFAGDAAGQAQRYLGAVVVTTDSSGNAIFDTMLSGASTSGEWITATATDLTTGDTSELSQGAPIAARPTATTSAGSTNYTENGAALAIDTGITVTDADSATLASASVSVGNFASGQDVLAFVNDGLTMGNIGASYDAATGVLTLTSAGASATLAQWQAALRAVTYSNTSDNPSTTNRTISFVLHDGTYDSLPAASANKTVTVTAVNDAPVLTTSGGTTAYTENGAPLAVDGSLTVTDADNGTLAYAEVTITGNLAAGQDVLAFANDGSTMGNITASYNAATGTLTLTSAGSTATVAQWQAALRAVTYANSADDPSTAARTVRFIVYDGSELSTGATKTLTVTGVNNAPTVTTTAGTSAYIENDVALPIDAGLTIADVDSATLASATVSITVNFVAGQDVLAFTNDGSTMGDISASYDAATGVLTLTSAGATSAQWQAALRAVTYANTSDHPGTAARTVSFVVNDGSLDSAVSVKSVSVTAVNDAPVGVAGSITLTEDTVYTFSLSDFGYTDVEGHALDRVWITTLPSQGTLAWNGTVFAANNWVFAIDIANGLLTYTPPADAHGSSYTSFTFQVQDTGGTANDGADIDPVPRTMTVHIAPVNDAPVVTTTGGASSYTEGAAPVVIDAGLTLADVDNTTLVSATVHIVSNFLSNQDVLSFVNDGATMGNISGTYLGPNGLLMLSSAGGTATLAQWQAALRSVTYHNTSNDPSTATRAIHIVVNDGSAASTPASRHVSVTAVNDAPTVTTSGGVTHYTENGAPLAVDAGLTVADMDHTTLSAATVSISGNFASGQDVLGFVNNGLTMGNIGASYDAATGVLTLSSVGSTATLAQWQAALRAVTYVNSSDAPGTADRSIRFTVNDGAADSVASTKTLSVTAVNDAPVVTPSAGSTTYTEGQAATTVDAGIAVTDVDSVTLASATVSITANFNGGQDVLAFVNTGSTMGDITGSYDAATGVLTLTSSGASAAQWQAALRAVTYLNTSDDPATAARVVTFVVNDGTASSAANKTLTVVAINNAPVVTTSGVTMVYVGNMPAQVVDAGLLLADADSTTLASATVGITGNFASGQDVLAFANDGSTMGDITASYNASTGVLTLTSTNATLAQWQSALRAVTYQNTAAIPTSGMRTFAFAVHDGQHPSAPTSHAMQVRAAPVVPVPPPPAPAPVTTEPAGPITSTGTPAPAATTPSPAVSPTAGTDRAPTNPSEADGAEASMRLPGPPVASKGGAGSQFTSGNEAMAQSADTLARGTREERRTDTAEAPRFDFANFNYTALVAENPALQMLSQLPSLVSAVTDASRGTRSRDEGGPAGDRSGTDEAYTFSASIETTGALFLGGAAGLWSLRASGLLASMLFARPLWTGLDPIPLLPDDDESDPEPESTAPPVDEHTEFVEDEAGAAALLGDAASPGRTTA